MIWVVIILGLILVFALFAGVGLLEKFTFKREYEQKNPTQIDDMENAQNIIGEEIAKDTNSIANFVIDKLNKLKHINKDKFVHSHANDKSTKTD